MEIETPDQILQRAATLERAGEWNRAAELFSRLFWRGVNEQNIEMIVDAVRSEARVRWQQGRTELAEELAYLAWEMAERNALLQAAARSLNLIANLHYQQENLLGAKALYQEALDRARDVSDDELIGLASMNLGVILSIEGDLREARQLYLEGIAAVVRSGNRASAAMVYNNLGTICTWLHEWLEAEMYFDRGIEIAEEIKNKGLLARLLMNRAEPLINFAEIDEASRSLDRAEELAGEVGEFEVLANATRFRSLIARANGDLAAAETCIAQGLDLAEEHELELERADLLEARADLRWEEGRCGEAVTLLEEARAAFRSLGAKRELSRVEQTLSTWSAVSG